MKQNGTLLLLTEAHNLRQGLLSVSGSCRGLDKCTMTGIRQHSVAQSRPTARRASCAPPCPLSSLLVPPHPHTPGRHWSVMISTVLPFSRVSDGRNHVVGSVFRLTSFTEQYAFKVPSCLFTVWQLLFFLFLTYIFCSLWWDTNNIKFTAVAIFQCLGQATLGALTLPCNLCHRPSLKLLLSSQTETLSPLKISLSSLSS